MKCWIVKGYRLWEKSNNNWIVKAFLNKERAEFFKRELSELISQENKDRERIKKLDSRVLISFFGDEIYDVIETELEEK